MKLSTLNYDSLTPEKLETVYFKSLFKINPIFHLLYSPIVSLTGEEKNSLLEALSQDHKEKFI